MNGKLSFCLVLLSWLLVSCSGMFPDIVSEEPLEGHTFSSAQVRQILIDQPFLLSGDYFLRRNPEKEATNLFQIFLGAGEKAKAEASEQEKRLAKLEEAVFRKKESPAPSSVAVAEYRIKVGFFIDYQNIDIRDGEVFLKVAKEITQAKGAIFVDHRDIQDVLSRTDCIARKDLGCMSKVVGIYPGARFLHLVEILEVPKAGKARARVSIVDTGLNYRYPSMEVEMPINNDKDRQEFMSIIASKLVEISLEKKNTMPWFCKAFSQDEKNRWFISAGSSSGIKEGDVLTIVSGGKIVNAPTGVPAGWIPGNSKGAVKVERIVNPELAIVTLESGAPPDLEDFLIPKGK